MRTPIPPRADDVPTPPAAPRRSNAWWIAALTALVVLSGMAYSLWWAAVVRHTGYYWVYPLDLFGTVRGSRWIEYGTLSYIYSAPTPIITLPGFAILLTPFVKLSELLGLITSTATLPLPRPSQWLLIGPLTMLTSAVALAGVDALARTLGLPLLRRRVLLVAEAAAVWEVTVRWGHPEDVLALGLVALALARAMEGRTVSAGWLLGGALAMQLYVVLLVPIVIGVVGLRRAGPLLARAALLPGAIFLAVVVPNARATLHVLFNQPTETAVNHPTPWELLAPHLGHGAVAGGPGRTVGLLAAVALGFLAGRRRDERDTVEWLGALALALRCLTEPVMSPYYVVPAIAFSLLAVAPRSWRRALVAGAAGSALTVLTYYQQGIWWYWFEMAAAFAALLAPSAPWWRGTGASGEENRPVGTLERLPSGSVPRPAGVVEEERALPS